MGELLIRLQGTVYQGNQLDWGSWLVLSAIGIMCVRYIWRMNIPTSFRAKLCVLGYLTFENFPPFFKITEQVI